MKVSPVPTSGVIPSTPTAWATPTILAVATGRVVRIHTIDFLSNTSEVIAVLEGHTASITIVLSLPGMRIASTSMDGTIRIWDVTTGQCLRTLDLANPVLHMAYAHSEQLLCLTPTELLHVRLTRDRSKRRRQLVRKLLSNILNKPSRVVSSADGSVVAVSDATNVHLTGLATLGVITTIRCRRVIVALAITQDGKIMAIADEAGVISLYRNPQSMIGSKRMLISWETAAPTQLHWHASAPQGLAFAHNDTILISAGSEAVLVTWRLAPALLGTRTFLPRLRSAIFAISVSPDERTYAISQSDNAVRLIDQLSSRVLQSVQAVPARLLEFSNQNPQAHLSSRVSPQFIDSCSVIADPVHHSQLWFAGAGSTIQLFDVFGGTLGEAIQIIPRNAVDEAFLEKKEDKSLSEGVSGLAAHESGRFLATADSQHFRSFRSEHYKTETAAHSLKLWYRENPNQTFVLNAVISQPHGSNCSISSLRFHPNIPLLVTTSRASRSFILWRATRSRENDAIGWRKEIELDYKGMACNDVCFSSDGSILFVACEHVLTMWKIENRFAAGPHELDYLQNSNPVKYCSEEFPISLRVEFLHVLVHPPSEEEILSIAYAYRSVPLVISVTRNGIYAWHALSQSIWWSTRVRSSSRKLAFDSNSGRFALQLIIPAIGADREDPEEVLAQRKLGEAIDQDQSGACATKISPTKPSKNSDVLHHGKHALNLNRKTPREKGEDVDSDPHISRNGKCSQQVASDAAVAIYDSGSPIPLHVHRLATEAKVAALSFVRCPGQMTGSPSTLVCVDSNMEVFLYAPDRGMALTGVAEHGKGFNFRGSTHSSNLENILAAEIDDHFKSHKMQISEDPAIAHEDYNALSQVVNKAFQRCFHGPTHVQAPAALNSFDFIKNLLEESRGAWTGKNEEEARECRATTGDFCREDHQDAKTEKLKSGAEGSPYRESDDALNHRAMRAFCVAAVRKAVTPISSAK